MKISIAMPAYKDAAGVNLTLACLRNHHSPELLKRIGLVVVDNFPEFAAKDGKAIAAGDTHEYLHMLSTCKEFRSAKLVPMQHPVGTAPAKDRAALECDGDLRIVIDSHVDFLPGSLEAVIEYFEQRPESIDLVQGALKFDLPGMYATHFNDTWGSEMWGQWAEAFRCGCGPAGTYFGTEERGGVVRFHHPADPSLDCESCSSCGRSLPSWLPWA